MDNLDSESVIPILWVIPMNSKQNKRAGKRQTRAVPASNRKPRSGSNRPRVRQNTVNGTIVRHKEYIGRFSASPSTATSIAQRYVVNPVMMAWMGPIARNFERYQTPELSLIFDTNSTALSPGSITVAYNSDPADGDYPVASLLSRQPSLKWAASSTQTTHVMTVKVPPTLLYTGATITDGDREANRRTCAGAFYFYLEGVVGSFTVDISIRYSIKLVQPRIADPYSTGVSRFVSGLEEPPYNAESLVALPGEKGVRFLQNDLNLVPFVTYLPVAGESMPVIGVALNDVGTYRVNMKCLIANADPVPEHTGETGNYNDMRTLGSSIRKASTIACNSFFLAGPNPAAVVDDWSNCFALGTMGNAYSGKNICASDTAMYAQTTQTFYQQSIQLYTYASSAIVSCMVECTSPGQTVVFGPIIVHDAQYTMTRGIFKLIPFMTDCSITRIISSRNTEPIIPPEEPVDRIVPLNDEDCGETESSTATDTSTTTYVCEPIEVEKHDSPMTCQEFEQLAKAPPKKGNANCALTFRKCS